MTPLFYETRMRPKHSVLSRPGQAVLVTLIFLLFASTALVASFASIALRETRAARLDMNGKQSYFLAEAGVEDVTWRIRTGRQYAPSQTVTLDGIATTVTVTTLGAQKTVRGDGNSASAMRRAQVTLQTGSSVAFAYGVQVGDLGLTMGNNSSIIGNIYSNGTIRGGGVGNTTITGTAVAAGNNTLQDARINGDAYANVLQSCSIGGTAHYVASITNCPSGATVHDPAVQPLGTFPIPQSQIDEWKADAASGGTLSGYILGNNTSATLGPKKISGNLTIGNNTTLTLTGTVWVTGAIRLGNGVTVQLHDATYGGLSGLLITDSAVDLGNTAVLKGTSQSGSYLMLLSNFGPGDAIDLGNSASSAILYAPNGVIEIGNNLSLREATARGLTVGNNSSVTYESGLANVNFSSGPGGGWDLQSWHEVK